MKTMVKLILSIFGSYSIFLFLLAVNRGISIMFMTNGKCEIQVEKFSK